MRRRFLLLNNPGAGLAQSSLLDRTLRALEHAGAIVERARPDNTQSARQIVKDAVASRDFDCVIAAGGDGTIRNIAAALAGTTMPVGIIPVGTGNVLAHEITLPPAAGPIARMLLDGPVTKVRCARANDELFLLMAGAGFDARVVAAVNQRHKSMLGKAAYAGPLLAALAHPMDCLSLTIDGQPREASWAVICNARHYGGRFVMAPQTGIEQCGLQAVLFKAKGQATLLSQLMSLMRGRLERRALPQGDVEMLACTRATICAKTPVPTQLDGDAFGATPLIIEANAAELSLIVPQNVSRFSSAGRPLRRSE
jgi:diacylglycerol kinase (ATP)